MKLNNKGFGLKELLIISAVLLLILLLLSYFVYTLYRGLEPDSNYEYMQNEIRLEVAAKNYVQKNKTSEGKIFTYEFLKNNGYVGELTHDCNGYVLYLNKEFNAYIKCDNYVSENYDKNIA